MAIKYIKVIDLERPWVLKVNGQIIKRFGTKAKGLPTYNKWLSLVGDFKIVKLTMATGEDKYIFKRIKKK